MRQLVGTIKVGNVQINLIYRTRYTLNCAACTFKLQHDNHNDKWCWFPQLIHLMNEHTYATSQSSCCAESNPTSVSSKYSQASSLHDRRVFPNSRLFLICISHNSTQRATMQSSAGLHDLDYPLLHSYMQWYSGICSAMTHQLSFQKGTAKGISLEEITHQNSPLHPQTQSKTLIVKGLHWQNAFVNKRLIPRQIQLLITTPLFSILDTFTPSETTHPARQRTSAPTRRRCHSIHPERMHDASPWTAPPLSRSWIISATHEYCS